MTAPLLSTTRLEELQRQSFAYFAHEVNPANGLVMDSTRADSPCSIAAVGLALSAYPVAVVRDFMSRAEAVERTLTTLRFFRHSPQGPEPDATGYRGFYYHFLDMQTGQRAWQCELSTIDTAILMAGMLTAARFFDGEASAEAEIQSLASELYGRVDWQWAQDGGAAVTHGWKPESGFLPYRWQGYCEALILYILGLGSLTHPLPPESYAAWTSTYVWQKVYDHELLHSAPLFTHQLSHCWLDFRGIQDDYMRGQCLDYFENSRRFTYAQRQHAVHNPGQFAGYGKDSWGFTASDGPGPVTKRVRGKTRHFYGYTARGIPEGPDDGSISPWAVAASLPFAPEIVLPALQHFEDLDLRVENPYGFKATFNPTFPHDSGESPGWVSSWHHGLNQGPIVLMIENFRSGLLWRLTRRCAPLVNGLRRAGFNGGWLVGQQNLPLSVGQSSLEERVTLAAPKGRPPDSSGNGARRAATLPQTTEKTASR